jgi:hypothetical protein
LLKCFRLDRRADNCWVSSTAFPFVGEVDRREEESCSNAGVPAAGNEEDLGRKEFSLEVEDANSMLYDQDPLHCLQQERQRWNKILPLFYLPRQQMGMP